MSIDTLNITHFRNITEASLTLHPSLNLFYGENGSGKTSLLEALYYLGYARSFRTHKKAALIQRQQQSFTLHALLHDHLKQPHSMGIERLGSQPLCSIGRHHSGSFRCG